MTWRGALVAVPRGLGRMPLTGPPRSPAPLERSPAFYERYLGLKRSDAGPPHAVVFDTQADRVRRPRRRPRGRPGRHRPAGPGDGAMAARPRRAGHPRRPLRRRRDDRLGPRRRTVRPHVHFRGPRRLPGDPARPRLTPSKRTAHWKAEPASVRENQDLYLEWTRAPPLSSVLRHAFSPNAATIAVSGKLDQC